MNAIKEQLERLARLEAEHTEAKRALNRLCPVPCDGRVMGEPGNTHKAQRAHFCTIGLGWYVVGLGVTKDGREMNTTRRTFVKAEG